MGSGRQDGMAKVLSQKFCHGRMRFWYNSARMKLNNPFLTAGYAGYKTDSGWIVYDRLFAEYLRRNA